METAWVESPASGVQEGGYEEPSKAGWLPRMGASISNCPTACDAYVAESATCCQSEVVGIYCRENARRVQGDMVMKLVVRDSRRCRRTEQSVVPMNAGSPSLCVSFGLMSCTVAMFAGGADQGSQGLRAESSSRIWR